MYLSDVIVVSIFIENVFLFYESLYTAAYFQVISLSILPIEYHQTNITKSTSPNQQHQINISQLCHNFVWYHQITVITKHQINMNNHAKIYLWSRNNIIFSRRVKLGLIQALIESFQSKLWIRSEIQTLLLNFKSPISKSDLGDSVLKTKKEQIPTSTSIIHIHHQKINRDPTLIYLSLKNCSESKFNFH